MTVTAVRPPARFGTIKITKDQVKYFKEKNHLDEGWINGGFFVMNPNFIKFINNDQTYLEKEPFEKITKKKQFVAFKHKGFWHCMDTLRDKEILEKKIRNKEHIEKNKILIAGGTGFIGYYLAKKCLSLNWSVDSISTKSPLKKRKLERVKYIKFDISKKKDLIKNLSQNYDYVVNLAGYVDHSHKEKTMRSHYDGCKNLSEFF